MPYMVQGNCVYKKNADGSQGEEVKCHANHEEAMAHMKALMANVEEAKAAAPKDPAMYAVVPDKEKPSTWKLRIDDATHVAAAITAMSPGGFRGQQVSLTPEQRSAAKRKISARIGQLNVDDDQKKNLRDRLSKVKEAEQVAIKADLYTQDEAAYVRLSANAGQACANCRWFNFWENSCQIVCSWPEPILPTGWCNEFVEHEQRQPEPMPVVNVEIEVEGQDEKEDAPITKSRVKALMDTVIGLFSKDNPPTPLNPQAIEFPTTSGIKALDDEHWLAWWTNTREDSHHEAFTRKAIDDYIARVDKGIVAKPELWFWHLGFTKHGKADTLARLGDYAVAIGHYDDSQAAKGFRGYYQQHKDLEVSHGFYYRPQVDLVGGVYHAFNTFEISVLPRGKAANPFTAYTHLEVKAMDKLTDEKKAELLQFMSEDQLNGLQAAAEKRGKEHGDDNVQTAYKGGLGDNPQGQEGESDKDKETLGGALDARLKALEDGAVVYATKADIEALQKSVNTLVGFLSDAFGTKAPASASTATEIPNQGQPAANPQDAAHALMAGFLQQQGQNGGQNLNGQKSLFGHMFAPVNGQGGE